MLLNPIDHPILYKIYLLLVIVALLNYGFKAMTYDPMYKVLAKTGVPPAIVYGLIGLAGVHFLLENLDTLKHERYRQGYKRQ